MMIFRTSPSSRLTPAQKDVIDRMRDGWELRGCVPRELVKNGEAPRHIKFATLESLERRGFIVGDWVGPAYVWVLA